MSRKSNLFLQVSGVAGLSFAILIVLGNAILVPAGIPVPGTAFDQVRDFFPTHGGTVGLVSALGPITWTAVTVFAAGAVVALWSTEPGWSLVGFAGLLLQTGTFTAVVALRLAATSAPDEGVWALHDVLFTMNGTFLAIAMLGLSMAGLRSGLIRRWHAMLGFVSAVFMVTSATLTPLVVQTAGPLGLIGLAGWLMWVVWIGTYGVTLFRLTPQHNGS